MQVISSSLIFPPIRKLLTATALLAVVVGAANAAQHPPGVAVASAHPKATAAGMAILAQGGNAFDAAVAVSAALAVVEPQSSGLGGGGFWLLHRAADSKDVMVDGRERAPGHASRTMYQNAQGKYIKTRSKDGPLAAGIPGEPAALAHIAKVYGKLPLATDLAPAIKLAREGFKVDTRLHKFLSFRTDVVARYEAAARLYLTADGKALPVGALLKQPALAETLKTFANKGHDGFYAGPLARKMVKAVRAAGGLWSLKDLASYQAVERKPIAFAYRDLKVVSASPPSSGGVVLEEALNILSGFNWDQLDAVHRKHVIVEALRRAYRDRAAYLGDPDFVKMPLARLASPFYADGLRVGIRMNQATPSSALAPPNAAFTEGPDTTHFSIIDSQGNRVAATLSINFPFGSGFVVPGTGVVLNDEMDDFSSKPLTPNGYGLIGTHANAIAPGKRPLSSMSPTFVIGPKRTAILGTPGGSRIISMVLLGILEFEGGGDSADIVGLPRFHHQYMPDQILYEPAALRDPEKQALRKMGYSLKLSDREYGNMQAVIWDRADNTLDAASDPRGVGAAAKKN